MTRATRAKLLTLLLPGALAAAAPAWASLGGTADSVEADRRALSAVRRATVERAGYTVHEFEVGATRVREYLSPAGVVFGVAWGGLTHPDLDTLLGSHAAAWREADREAPRLPGRRHRTVATRNLVVEKWGHMRNLRGRAYDPALLPPGVSADEIR
jgi:hypothetical protein